LDNFFRRKNYFGSFFCDFGKKRRNKKQIKLFDYDDDDDDDDVATHAAAFGGIQFDASSSQNTHFRKNVTMSFTLSCSTVRVNATTARTGLKVRARTFASRFLLRVTFFFPPFLAREGREMEATAG